MISLGIPGYVEISGGSKRRPNQIEVGQERRVHHSKPVKQWLSRYKDRFELVFLPSCCPELNPDEYLNNYPKQTVTREEPLLTMKALMRMTGSI